jgi:hypothetical protein
MCAVEMMWDGYYHDTRLRPSSYIPALPIRVALAAAGNDDAIL